MNYADTSKEFERTIYLAEWELAILMDRQRDWENLSSEFQLAERLHSLLCRKSHRSDCDWKEEGWTPETIGYTRRQWVKKGKELLKVADEEQLLEIVRIMAMRHHDEHEED